MAKRKGGSHKFASKAQWRWAFATHQKWARKHAHKSRPFKTLPYKTGHSRKLRG